MLEPFPELRQPKAPSAGASLNWAPTESSFGDVIPRTRRELNLTQDEVAARIKTSTPYVGHLEAGKRHPSQKVVTKLAEVLGLDRRELFFLANPHAEALLSPQLETTEGSVSAWEQFRTN